MIVKALKGAAAMALALTMTHCTTEDSAPVSAGKGEEMVGKVSFQIGTPFTWRFSREMVIGAEKVSVVKQPTFENFRNELYIVRRSGNRLQDMYYYEDEDFLDLPNPAFGPTNVNGTPSVAIALSGPDSLAKFYAYKTTTGKIDIWKGQTTGRVVASLTPGSTDFGNPALVFNTVTRKLELAHREGTRIRHWTLTRASSTSYTSQSSLIPGTGGTGTSVISALGFTQNTNGRLVVAARIQDRPGFGRLRHWGTSGATQPFTWTTGNIFGNEDASTEAPSLAPSGEGSVIAVARVRIISDTPELAQYEINNNVATQRSIFTPNRSQPVIARMETNSLYLFTLNPATGNIEVAHGTR